MTPTSSAAPTSADQRSGPDGAEGPFGPNQWLVDELRDQYRADPDSVDPAWARYFESEDLGSRPEGPQGPPATELAPEPDPAPQPASDPAPRPASDSAEPGAEPSERPAAHAAAPEPSRVPAPPAAPGSAPAPTPGAQAPKASAPAPNPPAPAKARSATADPAKAESSAPAAAARTRGRAPSSSDRPQRHEPAPLVEPEKIETVPDEKVKLRGPAARIVTNMGESLEIPTATSVRDVPVKLLFDNRIVINNHLRRRRGGKVSFTHLIGYAMVEALSEVPDMNNSYELVDGKPHLVRHHEVNFGLAIDLAKADGSRSLVVPSVKSAQRLSFAQFVDGYEALVRKARDGKLGVSDFQGTTATLTNPGGIGTVHSIPRLMAGQGVIVGVGAMDYPAEYQGASQTKIAELAVSKVMTLTSTYDHRIIQGAVSGEFLKKIADKLLGLDGFYDRVFRALRIPYEPVRWVKDNPFGDSESERLARVMDLIHAFRVRGHLMADIDPLEYRVRTHPDLDVATYGLTLWDLDRSFPTRGLGGTDRAPLRDILGVLRDAYCRTVGTEYMHITEPEERRFIQKHLEVPPPEPTREERFRILNRLNAAEAFETFLQTKFVGQKRFSLEGGEAVIPLLDAILDDASRAGLHDVGIGMAHRGRLNVLANLAGKSYEQIFREFDGNQGVLLGSGDVKYHLGTEGTYTGPDGQTTKVLLAANPSHLEAVNPVLEGIMRAKEDELNLGGRDFPVLPILVHGDAAMAGQGIVAETLALSELRGYRTGGTIHVVINNQIGFTTTPESSRSSYYATDIAKSTQLPIFHVNGEDPEAVVRIARLAFEFRQRFHRDVVVDMICYRKRGHNEGDDPSMTQPQMYRIIEGKRSVRKLYTESLIEKGALTEEEADGVVADFHDQLEAVFTAARQSDTDSDASGDDAESAAETGAATAAPLDTAVDPAVLAAIGHAHVEVPETFNVHPKVAQVNRKRDQMSREGGIDWGFAEILAFGSLLLEGTSVRLAGQDSRRGTFVQRHSVLVDHENGDTWTPLQHLRDGQARFNVYDSPLSEFGALGFDYGYSVEATDSLVLWEAQFGDFVNGAQTVIDEFISSSEQKWGQHSGLVLLLPHGYDGQGPDHSSARVERFLQLCAEDNLRVAMPSTPASYFHLLRRQARLEPRRPLVVFTPKSMLRLKAARSDVEDFTTGVFRPVLDDAAVRDPASVRTVLLCSGKVYYDLVAHRAETGADEVAIVRVEQLYPLPADELAAVLDRYAGARVRWVQEEPANQGAWGFMAVNLGYRLGVDLDIVSRPASASPAAGAASRHRSELADMLEAAFARG